MTLLEDMYDPERFRAQGHALIDLLAEHLAGSLSGRGKVLDWQAPATEDLNWAAPLPLLPTLSPALLMERLRDDILPAGLAIHHPRNLGHQVAPPLPLAALCDLVAALTNQAMAVYETGPAATMLERQVLRWLAQLVGWKEAGGVLTSGGAQANLTALLAARQHSADWDIWRQGAAAGPRLRILASEHAHYSVARAAGIMGLGVDAVVRVAADAEGRMEPAALAQAHQATRTAGAGVLAVVATAGCTPTGSIDPLQAIGAYCRTHDLWLHVDGAHGASLLLSEKHREALTGISLADSVVWDGHKLLYMPATVSAVLFRDPRHGREAFAQEASYLFQEGETHEFDTSTRTLECTKRMMGLKLWAAFSVYGVAGMARLVEQVCRTAGQLAERIESAADFTLLMRPQTNIVCFRHENVDQGALRRTLVESGTFHLTQVTLAGQTWLRTTIMNPLTRESDLDNLIESIRAVAHV